jgi:hypothetical protein
MSDESKKIEKIEQEAKDSEISDQDLENAAGGSGCSVGQTLAHVTGPCAGCKIAPAPTASGTRNCPINVDRGPAQSL